jgi:hypothetical protein
MRQADRALLAHEFSDLATPAEALANLKGPCQGFAQAGNHRYPLFGIKR